MPFLNGRSITMFRDRAATVREIARFNARDARAYEQLLADWDAIKAAHSRSRYSSTTTPSAALAELQATAPGVEAVRWRSVRPSDSRSRATPCSISDRTGHHSMRTASLRRIVPPRCTAQ